MELPRPYASARQRPVESLDHRQSPGTIFDSRRGALRLALLATLVVATTAPGDAIPEGYSTAPFRAGEVLRYRARWKFFHLGTLVVEQHPAPGQIDDSSAFEVRMIGDSSPGLPFVNVHFTNRSLLASRDPANRLFVYESSGDSPNRMVYSSDDSTGLHIESFKCGRRDYEGDLPTQGEIYDADGVFMALRCLAGSGLHLSVPTIVDREVHGTRVRFTNEVRTISVRAFPRGVRARYIEASAEWASQSCAGLTGHFDGWVTDDSEAIPVKLAFELALGSVVLELESLERPQEAAHAQ